MAQYRGYIKGAKGDASRLGHKTSGLRVSADAWNIGTIVALHWDDVKEEDIVSIFITSGSNNNAPSILIGSFRESDIREPLKVADALASAAEILRAQYAKDRSEYAQAGA